MNMSTASKPKFTYWIEGDFWLGYLEEYPDYQTQGTSLEELRANLADLYIDLSQGLVPSIRRSGELEIKWNEGIWSGELNPPDVSWFDMVGSMTGIKIQVLKYPNPFPGILK